MCCKTELQNSWLLRSRGDTGQQVVQQCCVLVVPAGCGYGCGGCGGCGGGWFSLPVAAAAFRARRSCIGTAAAVSLQVQHEWGSLDGPAAAA